MKQIEVFIDERGNTTFIYDDELSDLIEDTESTTRRASHVEPAEGGWEADMQPILDRVDLQKQSEAVMVFGGPVLGPFTLRKDALKAESNWINLFLAKYYDETFAQSIGQTASTE